MNSELKIGDKVYRDEYTSIAQGNAGEAEITNRRTVYDEDSGNPYILYEIEGDEWYDSRNGGCWSNKESMYYIEEFSEN